MQPKQIDLLVIGGGINGVGVALDAAGRGLSVVLCEKDDLAQHTSSASSKLIHGGLRYLEQYKFKLVHEALREREILLHNAPHLVCPLEFVLPYANHLRPAWMIRLGLLFYDYLTPHKGFKRSHKIDFITGQYGYMLAEKFRFGFSYMDCRTDDARLVVMSAMLARQKGATILTRTEAQQLERHPEGWRVTLYNKRNAQTQVLTAKAVVNATGAWVEDLLKNKAKLQSNAHVKWVKGSHIVVPKIHKGNFAYILQNTDQRIIFIIPYKNRYSLIGTTDVVYTGDPNNVEISEEEINYLLKSCDAYMKYPLKRESIVWTYAGIRALYDEEKSAKPAKITREYHLEVDDDGSHYPLLSIFGGKLTTYRRLAEHAMEKLKRYFPGLPKAWTHKAILPGGDLGSANFASFVRDLQKWHPQLPVGLLNRYVENYGGLALDILSKVNAPSDLGRSFSHGLYEVEVKHLLANEWAETSEDILWRRTKLGLSLSVEEAQQLDEYCKCYFNHPI